MATPVPVVWRTALRDRGPDDFTPAMRAILYTLATYADNRTGICYPSQRTIARGAGVASEMVSRSLTIAESKGWIRKIRKPGRVNLEYQLLVPPDASRLLDAQASSSRSEQDALMSTLVAHSASVPLISRHTNSSRNYSKNSVVDHESRDRRAPDVPRGVAQWRTNANAAELLLHLPDAVKHELSPGAALTRADLYHHAQFDELYERHVLSRRNR
jgi:DNA-binding MarR family transcriptional regulator